MMDSVLTSPRILSQDKDALTSTGWLASRSRGFQAALLKHASVRIFAEGETLYLFGDAAEGLFGVVSGALNVSIPADDGQEFVAHRDGSGFWIGDLAMLSDQTRLVSVVAAQVTRTLFVPSVRILEMLAACPEYYKDFYSLTHDNMQLALRILANLAVTRTDQRLALRLLHLSETNMARDGWIALSQAELAGMAAVSVPTLQRVLHRLSGDGVLELGYGRLRVVDRAGLMALCQS